MRNTTLFTIFAMAVFSLMLVACPPQKEEPASTSNNDQTMTDQTTEPSATPDESMPEENNETGDSMDDMSGTMHDNSGTDSGENHMDESDQPSEDSM